ncbi:WecB/TagA/CpsF family glycosyltransferase [Hymenobacter lapidiphilus]|uniref:WecB/TagA/CpsF family glycosyltransferase n=1 Tax=Hymenobacter lapidiphilus TaxID=2608003 RepID=A0A7Y7U685_9BACT|nr:WecB/TagA/CpsF family glycosyltransferase [Hymenobacter lapidiphilus]NVO32551.1 WecB/TagA/CpsF family glycosyltransferase [Hymenobacter lapidiphilus]
MPRILAKYAVLKTQVSAGTPADFLAAILRLGAARGSGYVCCANVHMLVEAHHQPDFRRLLNQARVVTPDGSPVAASLRWLHGQPQARVAGMDLLPALLTAAAAAGQSVYFYGTTEEVLAALVARARRELPTLQIAGWHAPPFRPLTPAEDAADVAAINVAQPNLLFVALGCPRQERWMAAHDGRVQACMLGVGQAFRVYAGFEPRLPPWARPLWLEWAFRLWQEPRRLAGRYLRTNPLFVYLLARELLLLYIGRAVAPGQSAGPSRPRLARRRNGARRDGSSVLHSKTIVR